MTGSDIIGNCIVDRIISEFNKLKMEIPYRVQKKLPEIYLCRGIQFSRKYFLPPFQRYPFARSSAEPG
ncbi:hypothetical protein ACSAZL_00870 [Methanosarcina sp. T3]|uniref:hypothetical protein n=1 Tax=Methanosarcina sp. T3 TaxID=3439062 RepID=UPI003F83670D